MIIEYQDKKKIQENKIPTLPNHKNTHVTLTLAKYIEEELSDNKVRVNKDHIITRKADKQRGKIRIKKHLEKNEETTMYLLDTQ